MRPGEDVYGRIVVFDLIIFYAFLMHSKKIHFSSARILATVSLNARIESWINFSHTNSENFPQEYLTVDWMRLEPTALDRLRGCTKWHIIHGHGRIHTVQSWVILMAFEVGTASERLSAFELHARWATRDKLHSTVEVVFIALLPFWWILLNIFPRVICSHSPMHKVGNLWCRQAGRRKIIANLSLLGESIDSCVGLSLVSWNWFSHHSVSSITI